MLGIVRYGCALAMTAMSVCRVRSTEQPCTLLCEFDDS